MCKNAGLEVRINADTVATDFSTDCSQSQFSEINNKVIAYALFL